MGPGWLPRPPRFPLLKAATPGKREAARRVLRERIPPLPLPGEVLLEEGKRGLHVVWSPPSTLVVEVEEGWFRDPGFQAVLEGLNRLAPVWAPDTPREIVELIAEVLFEDLDEPLPWGWEHLEELRAFLEARDVHPDMAEALLFALQGPPPGEVQRRTPEALVQKARGIPRFPWEGPPRETPFPVPVVLFVPSGDGAWAVQELFEHYHFRPEMEAGSTPVALSVLVQDEGEAEALVRGLALFAEVLAELVGLSADPEVRAWALGELRRDVAAPKETRAAAIVSPRTLKEARGGRRLLQLLRPVPGGLPAPPMD